MARGNCHRCNKVGPEPASGSPFGQQGEPLTPITPEELDIELERLTPGNDSSTNQMTGEEARKGTTPFKLGQLVDLPQERPKESF
jgi:hypothetical protein